MQKSIRIHDFKGTIQYIQTDYEVILEEASKCFKLKASDTRLESMSDEREGPSGNVHDWKIKIPRIKISTNFICRNC